MTPKLILSLSLGLLVLGAKADSINGQSLQKMTLEAEAKPSHPQLLTPNSRLRVLIDPSEDQVSSPQTIAEQMESAAPLARSWDPAEAQTPNIIKYPDGTISMVLDRRHLKYLSAQSCTGSKRTECKNRDLQIRH